MKIQEFRKVAEMLAKEHKISIQPGERWAANIGQRIVYYVEEDILSLNEEHILGLTLHEIAHIHYTTETTKQKKNKELMHSTMNMLEDISIENIISNDYPNAGEILTSTKQEVLDTLVKALPKMDDVSKHEKALLFAAARFEDRGYEDGTADYEKVGNKIEEIMKTKKNKQLILKRKETEELLPLAKKIVKLLIKELGEPTQQEKDKMNENAQGETEGQAHQNQYDENGKLRKGIKGKIIDKLKAGNGWKGEGKELATNINPINEVIDQAGMVGRGLRKVLKRNNAMEFGGRYRTGKLISKSFVRIRALHDRNPFTRRIVKSNQSYAFTIAADVSGSMMGSNINYATSSLLMVAEALRCANTPRALMLFGGNSVLIKPISTEQIRWEEIIEEKNLYRADQGNTRIDTAMKESIKQLDKVRAERKIMIILTDGSSYLDDMQEQHKIATKKGIECIGIKIGSNQHEEKIMEETFGKNTVTIENTSNSEQIATEFIKILKSTIKKSNT